MEKWLQKRLHCQLKKLLGARLGIPEKRAETLFGERCYKRSHLKESLWLSSSKRSVGKLLKQSKICIYTQKEKLFPIEQQFRLFCVNISYWMAKNILQSRGSFHNLMELFSLMDQSCFGKYAGSCLWLSLVWAKAAWKDPTTPQQTCQKALERGFERYLAGFQITYLFFFRSIIKHFFIIIY